MQELIVQQRISMSIAQMGMLQSLIVLILIIINSLFVKEFIPNKWWFYFVVSLSGSGFVLLTLSHSVPSFVHNHELFRILSLMAHCCVLCSLCFTFYAAAKDIFRLKHDLSYSLLGAANIFILIGSIFSFIINISGSVFVGMVVPLDQMITLDIHAFKLSFYALAGMDIPFDNVNPFIKNILVVESIFSHLFAVMIVGRLLSK